MWQAFNALSQNAQQRVVRGDYGKRKHGREKRAKKLRESKEAMRMRKYHRINPQIREALRRNRQPWVCPTV